MRRSLHFARFFSASAQQTGSAINLRTLVRPFIKAIHPDLLPSDSPSHIKQANIACLQALNGLLDQLHKVKEGSGTIRASIPTRTALEFYVPGAEQMRKASAMIKIPAQLGEAYAPAGNVERHMQAVVKQFEHLNSFVGQQQPSDDPSKDRAAERGEVVTDMLNSWYSNAQLAGYTSVEDSLQTMTERVTLLDAIAGGQRSNSVLEAQVHGFIRGQRLILHNIDDETAEEAVEKLKHFLCDYGNEINFSLRTWRKVIIVLGEYKKPGLVKREGWFILQVPVVLKPMRLLKLIIEELPCADHLAYDPLDTELDATNR